MLQPITIPNTQHNEDHPHSAIEFQLAQGLSTRDLRSACCLRYAYVLPEGHHITWEIVMNENVKGKINKAHNVRMT